MRRPRSNPKAGKSRRFPRGLLLSAAVGFGVLWVGVVALATGGVDGVPLLVLGCAGFSGPRRCCRWSGATRRSSRASRRTDPLTGLANHRGFHQELARQLERARRGNGRLAPGDARRGPLQGRQRRPRALLRRRGPEIDRQGPQDRRQRPGHRGAPRRRGVRAHRPGARRGGRLSRWPSGRGTRRAPFRFAASSSPARRAWRPIRTTPRTRRASASSPRARSTGQSAAARGARVGSIPGTSRSAGPGDAPPRSSRAARVRAADHAGVPAGGGPRERPPGGLRGAGALHELRPSAPPRPGLRRPTAAAWAPTSRRRRSARPSSRSAGRSAPISRSTSARPRSPPAPVVRALPRELTGIVIEITEHEFVSEDDHLADVLDELRERGALIAIDDAGAGYAGPDPGHAGPARHRQARSESHQGDPRRPGADGRWSNRSFASPGAPERSSARRGSRASTSSRCSATSTSSGGRDTRSLGQSEPWAMVSPVAAEVCRASLAQALRASPSGSGRIAAGDRRLEHLSARLASARSGAGPRGRAGPDRRGASGRDDLPVALARTTSRSSRPWPRAAAPARSGSRSPSTR